MQTKWIHSIYINSYIENFGMLKKRHQRASSVPRDAGLAQGHWFLLTCLRLEHQEELQELSVETTIKTVETEYRTNVREN